MREATEFFGGAGSPGPWRAPGLRTTGPVAWALGRWDGFAPWVSTARLGARAEARLAPEHSEMGIVVVGGTVEVESTEQPGRVRLGPGSAVLAEASASATLRSDGPSRLAAFGSTHGPGARHGRDGPAGTLHVIGAGGVAERRPTDVNPVHARSFADATCPTCDLNLLRIACDRPYRAASHVHSADEIILLIDGDLQVGTIRLGPGDAVAIPHGIRYSFVSRRGFDFLNFRPGSSTVVQRPGSDPIPETAAGLGMVPVAGAHRAGGS